MQGTEVYEKTGELIPDSLYKSVEKNKIAIKGPIGTPIGKGFRSINVYLRKKIRPLLKYKTMQKFYRE